METIQKQKDTIARLPGRQQQQRDGVWFDILLNIIWRSFSRKVRVQAVSP